MVGFAQTLTAFTLVGWGWAIWHGWKVKQVSDNFDPDSI
jgi:hypothetical protein